MHAGELFMISVTAQHPLDMLYESKPDDDDEGGAMKMRIRMIWRWMSVEPGF